jgi:cell division septal protein FtsQ
MFALAPPADRRFRRVQVRPRRRRWWWRFALAMVKLGMVGATAGLLAWQSGEWLRAVPGLRITRLVISGTEQVSAGEVRALVGDLEGRNILFVNLDEWRRRLLGLPWVAEAALRRILPSTIAIQVHERRPVGLARLGTRLFLVDAAGIVIDEYGPRYRRFVLPIIDGLAVGPQQGPTAIDPARAALAARLLAALQPRRDLAGRVSQIDVSNVQDAAVLLEGDSAWLHLGTERFAERLQTYLDVLPVLGARVPARESVDLRFDERIYVRPLGPTPRGPASEAGAAGRARPF